jgi:hypothetical protein
MLMTDNELIGNTRRLLKALSAQVDAIEANIEVADDYCVNQVAGLRRDIAELVIVREELRERAERTEAAVAALREALVKASTDQTNEGRGRTNYCTYCLICGSIGCGHQIEHTSDCYVGQAISAADAVLRYR